MAHLRLVSEATRHDNPLRWLQGTHAPVVGHREFGAARIHPLITHRYSLDAIVQAYVLFGNRAEGVLKIAVRP